MSTKDTNPKDIVGDKKTPLWLLSPIAKAAWAVAHFAGMLKYGAWNWRAAGVRASIYLSAIERHLDAYKSGEEYDPVDGSHHLGNIMACAAILLDARAAGKLTDDRPPSVSVRPAYAEAESTMAKLREQYKNEAPRHYTIADRHGSAARGYSEATAKEPESKLEVGTRVRVKESAGTVPVWARGRAGTFEGYLDGAFPFAVQLDGGDIITLRESEFEVLH